MNTAPSIGRFPGILGACCSLVLAFVGCQSESNLPPLAEVRGTATLDGQPLPRGVVQFSPDTSQGSQGPTAVGNISADGTYELETAGQRGAMVGLHRVRVTSQELPRDETDTLPRSLIPQRYNNPATSGLTGAVAADQANTIDLQLNSSE